MSKNLIVFCPGYTGLPPKPWNPLLRRFEDEGYDTISVNYKYFGRGSIGDTAKRVSHIVQPLRDNYEHICFVGHSMGGLVARKTLNVDPALGDSLITLGSPHRGTEAAISPLWWLGGKSVGQMQPMSKTIKHMTIPAVPILTVSGRYDLLVKNAELPEAQYVEGPTKRIVHTSHIELPTTHLGLILSHRVFGEIYSWLQYEIIGELPV